MNNKAQATLEFTLIFVVMVALLFGLLGLWKWSSDNIIRRQIEYNAGRVSAGSTTPGEPAKSTETAEIDASKLNLFK